MNTQTTTTSKRVYLLITCLCLSFLLSQCFLTQDSTTVVYGIITNQNGQPVDSILVTIKGVDGFKYERLKEVYSGEDGSYELVVDVPRKYGSANVVVPFGSYDNPKYERNYKGKKTSKNDQFTNNCCKASIGDKTKYDFQLIPR
ncbi:hypothetical protein [Dyadobacter sp. CY343]|uniref:hypothetical protein n=1 Tax=Dyadobacter sp. CY343 TaxID=2907299 RepID=UPI001F21B4CB|nr:hypothetical protein [Dyadobacter sp. CY343]MCE7060921.1 hypothetical protein [Dyadobacter sp. CY343]